MKTISPLPAIALLFALAAPGAALAARPVAEEIPLAPDGRVEIENMSGSVTVQGWDQALVRITGTVGDDTEGLEIDQDGSSVSIEVEIPDHSGSWGSNRRLASELEIMVPAGSSVSVETVSAGITVSGVRGDLEMESVSGSIGVDGAGGRVEAESVSGSIRIAGSGVRVDAESVSGSVKVTGAVGDLDVSSVSGSIEVEAGELRRADFESVSGSVELTGRLAAGSELHAESHSGNVILRLPADTSARFDIETFSGDVDNAFGPGAERVSRYAPGKRLEFSIGSGAAEVSIETFSGNVILRRE